MLSSIRLSLYFAVAALVLALTAAPSQAQFSYPFGSGFGTLSYSTSSTPTSCMNAYRQIVYYTRTTFRSFDYVDSSANINQSFSNTTYYNSSENQNYGGYCPPMGPGPTIQLNGNGYTISVTPDDGSQINGSVTTAGYVNPKYVVVGVVYAPPGSNSYVSYTSSTTVSSTIDITNTFSSSTGVSVSLKRTGSLFGFLGGSQTSNYSSTLTQSSQDSKSVTASYTDTSTLTEYGPGTGANNNCYVSGGDYVGVDHDCDIIKVWVNPVALVTLTNYGEYSGTVAQWNGYGYSELDTTAPIHIVDVLVGCLNGDFSPSNGMCSSALGEFGRTWASNENWPSGQGPGLTQTDLNTILATDPWGQCKTTSPIGSSACPTYSSPGFVLLPPEFSLSDDQNVPYQQGAPQEQWTVQTGGSNTQGQESTTTNKQTFGYEDAFSLSVFHSGLSATVSASQTLQWKHEVNNSTTVSNTFTGTAYITGPACNGSPCSPTYPPSNPVYGQATEVDIFVDSFFGTFAFVPSSYQ